MNADIASTRLNTDAALRWPCEVCRAAHHCPIYWCGCAMSAIIMASYLLPSGLGQCLSQAGWLLAGGQQVGGIPEARPGRNQKIAPSAKSICRMR
jgi:hypothetical protein